MHVTAALLNEGFRVGTMDLDVRQRSLSRYIENRKIWVGRRAVAMPEHYPLEEFNYNDLSLRQRAEQEQFVAAMTHLRAGNDFIVVDSPGTDSYLSRLGHAAADTLITPINESFVDFDLLAMVDPDDLSITGPAFIRKWSGHAARRAQADGGSIDWIVVRNRTSHIHAKNRQRVETALDQLAHRLGFRQATGLSERVIFREMYPAGITLLDLTDEEANTNLTMSHVAARAECARCFGVKSARRRALMGFLLWVLSACWHCFWWHLWRRVCPPVTCACWPWSPCLLSLGWGLSYWRWRAVTGLLHRSALS